MAKPRDCIYCAAPARAGEHTFVAGLGGRRTNRGILCGPCEKSFRPLDRLLIDQLAGIRGLLGVRPDHRDQPLPALVDTDEGKMALDDRGQPSWPIARLRHDVTDEQGVRTVTIEAGDEAQVQKWIAEQRAKGLDVRKLRRVEGQRFLDKPAQLSWSFGGEDAFREVARIALNILATHDPHAARLPGLAQVKGWIRGRPRGEGEGPYVWHHDGSIVLPDCAFQFGHRIALRARASTGVIDALVSFFDTIAYVVSFGSVGATRDDVVIFDIDPHAETAPHDLQIIKPAENPFPHVIARPPSSAISGAQAAHLRERFARLMQRIEERQHTLYLTPVADQLNAARALSRIERRAAVVAVVGQCRGHVLKLARHASEQFAVKASTAQMKGIADAIAALIRMDPTSTDGLSEQARVALSLAEAYLADAIERELDDGPLSVDRTILLLNGTPGAAVVFRAILEPILLALGIPAESVGL